MTTDRKQRMSEIASELSKMDEQALFLVFATFKAWRLDPDRAELRALVEAMDPEPITAWLRSHGWLADDNDPVLKLGPVSKFTLAQEEAEQKAVTAMLEAEDGWILDIFHPDRERPSRDN